MISAGNKEELEHHLLWKGGSGVEGQRHGGKRDAKFLVFTGENRSPEHGGSDNLTPDPSLILSHRKT